MAGISALICLSHWPAPSVARCSNMLTDLASSRSTPTKSSLWSHSTLVSPLPTADMSALLCACVLFTFSCSYSVFADEELRYDKLYEDGVEAYLDERWDDCISKFEGALHSYRTTKDMTVNCRLKCQNEADTAEQMFPENIDNLHFYEKLVKKTLCLLRCKKVLFKDKTITISKELEANFENLKSYEYLQLCYFQKNLPQKAASAVFTYLVENPEHETMLSNLKFYTALPDVDVDNIVNFEAHPFVGLYVHGSDAYKHEEYPQVINYIEESLEEYLRAEEACRAHCEGPFDQGWFPDYTSSVANHFTYCLKCKRKCPLKLNTLNGERHEDLLPSHYHYLQFAYYKVGDIEKACQAVASYLLFYPVDETMLSNLAYYKSLPKAKDEYFEPREEAIKYVKRQAYETMLLNFIDKQFIFDDETSAEENAIELHQNTDTSELGNNPQALSMSYNGQIVTNIPRQVISEENVQVQGKTQTQFSKPLDFSKDQWNGQENGENPLQACLKLEKKQRHSERTPFDLLKRKEENSCDYDGKTTKENNDVRQSESTKEANERPVSPKRKELKGNAEVKLFRDAFLQDVKLVKSNAELTGTNRFIAEGLAKEKECRTMIDLAEVAGQHGNGYGGNPSPYTLLETFEGMSTARAAMMVYFGMVEPKVLDMFFEITERGRAYLERHFDLKEKLYFDFSHLVCRTASLEAKDGSSPHMSHPIHADNCIAAEDGSCRKINPPMFIWRDYSAIIYLNDDFEGGEFIFTGNLTESSTQSVVKAKCGRMVGFSAGAENLHGVRGVISGRRCAIGLWFTLDPKHNESERILAQILRNRIRMKGNISDQLLQQLKHMGNFK